MQTEQIIILCTIVFAIGVIVGWKIGESLAIKTLAKLLPQPDNKSYQTKKKKAEVSSHGYNEVVTLTDKRNADLAKGIEDEEKD